jgi:hypothetical protein
MKSTLTKKLLNILCVGAIVCAGAGIGFGSAQADSNPIKGEDKVAYQPAQYNWRLVGTPYTIEGYSSVVRVFDPNGNPVAVQDGRIILTVAGEYSIVYPSKVERLQALLYKPQSEMELSKELFPTYSAGTILSLPALSVENIAYDFAYYYVEVRFNGTHTETMKVKVGESTDYLLAKDGEYGFTYYVLNDRGEKESVTVSTVAKGEKAILIGDLPTTVNAGKTLSFGNPYAFYEGKV